MPGLIIAALLLLLLLGLVLADRSAKEAQVEREAPITFPNAKVRLDAPLGFATALDFEGFGLPESKASVMALRLNGPFHQIETGFTEEALHAQGMILLAQEKRHVGPLPGLLLQVRQTVSGIEFEKWLLVFGDDDDVHLVTAAYPRNQSQRFSHLLKGTVLSARRDTGQTPKDSPNVPGTTAAEREAVLFRVDSGSALTQAFVIGKMLAFTRDGSFPVPNPTEALFIVAPSLGAVNVADQNQFARDRIQLTEQMRGVTIMAQSPIRVDGMDGVEIVARASDSQTGTPLTVYQTILFDNIGYYLMQGMVGLDDTGIYLPVFKTVARTFRRTVAR